MKKKKESFKFHYKDESREIRITASSKSVERFCKPQKEIVQPACQSRKDKVERNITIIVSVLTIIGYIYKTLVMVDHQYSPLSRSSWRVILIK